MNLVVLGATGRTGRLVVEHAADGMGGSLAGLLDARKLVGHCRDDALGRVGRGGRAVGGELASHPAVVALSFTGSYGVGNQIYQQLARRMARAQMEMGGKNPTIVLADADLDLAEPPVLGNIGGRVADQVIGRHVVLDLLERRHEVVRA